MSLPPAISILRALAIVGVVPSIACAFDSNGYGPYHGSVGEASSEGDDDDDGDAEASTDGGGANDSDAPPSADDHGDDSDASRGESSDDDGGSSSAPPQDGAGEHGGGEAPGETGGEGSSSDDGIPAGCPDEVFSLHWADAATVESPMQLVETDALMEPNAAASAIADEGTATFSVDIACPGQYAVWGLVWDYAPGAYATDDPDSFFITVDDDAEQTWRYGCQSGETLGGLSWQRLLELQAQPCDAVPLVLDVAEPGTVALRFRNREPGYDSQVAAIAAIVIASDPDADPSALYEPY